MANRSAAKVRRLEARLSQSLARPRSRSTSRSRSRTSFDAEESDTQSPSEASVWEVSTPPYDECISPTRNRLSRIEHVSELSLDSLSINPSSSPSLPPSPPPAASPAVAPKSLHPAPLRISKSSRSSSRLTRSPSPMNLRPVRLLVASLGNPQPYHSTRHSAAHILLKAFVSHLNLPVLTKNKQYGGGSVSFGSEAGRSEYTLWQSGSQMNISGKGLLQAWKEFTNQQRSTVDAVTGLVVLHDELETAPGQLKLRRGEGSARGHNGIKSVQTSLNGGGLLQSLGEKFIKIGIGIGRPVSREKDEVSAFVLGQVTGKERRGIEGRVGELEMLLQGEVERIGRNEK